MAPVPTMASAPPFKKTLRVIDIMLLLACVAPPGLVHSFSPMTLYQRLPEISNFLTTFVEQLAPRILASRVAQPPSAVLSCKCHTAGAPMLHNPSSPSLKFGCAH